MVLSNWTSLSNWKLFFSVKNLIERALRTGSWTVKQSTCLLVFSKKWLRSFWPMLWPL